MNIKIGTYSKYTVVICVTIHITIIDQKTNKSAQRMYSQTIINVNLENKTIWNEDCLYLVWCAIKQIRDIYLIVCDSGKKIFKFNKLTGIFIRKWFNVYQICEKY